MFLSRNDLTFHLSHLKIKVIDELIECFELKEYIPGFYNCEEDMIFLRGEMMVVEE